MPIVDTTPSEQLKSVVERIERLEEEKKAIGDDIRDVYQEAKANGYDTKALRECIKLRKLSDTERTEREAILDTYLANLGMLPLFEPLNPPAESRTMDA